jgi:hypothetical protein
MNHTRMMRPRLISVTLLLVLGIAASAPAQLAGEPGAFARMGFGARGMAMGNAMSAVVTGDIASYYNPALLPFAETRQGSASMGMLSLDRSLNFLTYAMPLPPKAGLAVSLINAGVSNIDGRDGDGQQTGALRTSENVAFLSFAIAFSPQFSAGVSAKLHYYHLYTDVSSTTFGFDFGALYKVTSALSAAVTIRNVSSRYKWDTASLFGQSGQTSEARFPTLTTAGVAYQLGDDLGVVSGEVEFSDKNTILARAGYEITPIPEVSARFGVDRLDLKNNGDGYKPSIGFTFRKPLGGWTPQIHYAFIVEPFSPEDVHIITVSVAF